MACNRSGYRKFKRRFSAVCWAGAGRTRAGLGAGRRVGADFDAHAADFGSAGPRSVAARVHFSPHPDSGPNTVLRAVAASCRFPVFAPGSVTGGGSRGFRRRCARCRPVVRLRQRAVLLEVVEDGADGLRFLDTGDDLHLAATVDAGFNVDAKDALYALGLGHRAALFFGRSIIRIDGVARRLAAFAVMRRCQRRAELRVRAKMPWNRVRCARGGGTSAASLPMNSTGSNSTCVVRFFHGVLSA